MALGMLYKPRKDKGDQQASETGGGKEGFSSRAIRENMALLTP
jgi:hypothetical protein